MEMITRYKGAFIACLAFICILGFFLFFNQSSKEKVYKVGIIIANEGRFDKVTGFMSGMEELGWHEGENIQYVMADLKKADSNKEQELVGNLIKQKPDLIVTTGARETEMVRGQSRNIPIVFIGIASPAEWGMMQDVHTGEVTGIDNGQLKLIGKRMEVLIHIISHPKTLLVIGDTKALLTETAIQKASASASRLGLNIEIKKVSSNEELRDLLMHIQPGQYSALLPLPGYLLEDAITRSLPILKEKRLFVMGSYPEQVQHGLFAAYGISFVEQGRQAASLTARMLSGHHDTVVRVETPNQIKLSVNQAAIHEIGLVLNEQQRTFVYGSSGEEQK